MQTLPAMTMTAIPGQGMSGDTLRVTVGNALTHSPGCGLPERSRGLRSAVSMAYHNTRINRRGGGPLSYLVRTLKQKGCGPEKALPGYPIGAWDAHLYR